MRIVKLLWELMHKGRAVADKKLWAAGLVGTNAVAGVLYVLLEIACESAKFCPPVGGETVDLIAGGIVGVVNLCLLLMASERVGLSPRHSTDPG